MDRASRRLLGNLAAVLVLGSACASSPAAEPDGPPADVTTDVGAIPAFPVGAAPDYQLGGAYDPDAVVGVVGRDREAEPTPGAWSMCYVNGFQTQPGELDLWPAELLLQRDGDTVFDPDWPDEALVDTSSAARRAAVVDLVGPWIEGCAEAGFDAVELDNLDTFTRSDGALTLEDNLALAADLVDVAHDVGLAAGQKNAAEHTARLHADAGFDFAVVEECAAYDECDVYTETYGDAVVDIEYTDALPRPFEQVCATVY